MMRRERCLVAVVAGLLAGLFGSAGCGQKEPPLPPTHSVVGTVRYKNGKPLTGGLIQFAPVQSDEFLAISSPIKPDGTFTLTTARGDQTAEGAVEGNYRVTIMPPAADDNAIEPVTLPRPYTVRPGVNNFIIELDPPGKVSG